MNPLKQRKSSFFPCANSGKRRIARILLAVSASLIGLLVSECVIRFMGLAPEIKPIEAGTIDSAYRRSSNPLLAYELKPNYRNDKADSVTTYAWINSHGQRDIERTVHKKSGTTRILILGDSVVEGHGIQRLEDLMNMQLEALFDDDHVEVLNFGVSGYNTRSEVELLETRGLAFQPDVVVLVFVQNDFDHFVREAFPLSVDVPRPAVVKTLFKHSHLARLAMLQTDLFGFRRELLPVEWHKDAMGNNNVTEGLKRLKTLSVETGFDLFVAVWPRFTEENILDYPWFSEEKDLLAVEFLCGKFQIPCFRLSEFFVKDYQSTGYTSSPRAVYTLGDELHPSVLGCALAARSILTVLNSDQPERYLRDLDRVHDPSGNEDFFSGLGRPIADTSRVLYNQALHMEKRGDIEGAQRAYLQVLREDPNYVDAMINYAVLLAGNGAYEEARSMLEKAASMKATAWGIWYNLGNIELILGQMDSACEHFQRAVDLEPDTPISYLALARCLEEKKSWKKTLSTYRQVYKRFPRDVRVLLQFGQFLLKTGEVEDAKTLFESVVELDPDHLIARELLQRVSGIE